MCAEQTLGTEVELVRISVASLSRQERGDSWRAFVSKMIHKVEISGASAADFSAEISVRKHDLMSCGLFWSRPHRLRWAREQSSDAGAAGYLVSWQLQGEAHIEQGNERVIQPAGSIAIADARRAMSVTFPGEVRRIVAKMPAGVLEARLPRLLGSHLEVFHPSGPFAPTLLSYFTELSRDESAVLPEDMEALVENVANLLKITSGATGRTVCDSRDIRRRALVSYLKRHACEPSVSVDAAAAHLNISRRLVQQVLQDMDTTFTQFVIDERLRAAAARLSTSRGLPVSQIAYLCGFNDVSHFNHLFKRRFGVAPSSYRSNAQEAAALAA